MNLAHHVSVASQIALRGTVHCLIIRFIIIAMDIVLMEYPIGKSTAGRMNLIHALLVVSRALAIPMENAGNVKMDITFLVPPVNNARHASRHTVHIALNVIVIPDALSVKKDIS